MHIAKELLRANKSSLKNIKKLDTKINTKEFQNLVNLAIISNRNKTIKPTKASIKKDASFKIERASLGTRTPEKLNHEKEFNKALTKAGKKFDKVERGILIAEMGKSVLLNKKHNLINTIARQAKNNNLNANQIFKKLSTDIKKQNTAETVRAIGEGVNTKGFKQLIKEGAQGKKPDFKNIKHKIRVQALKQRIKQNVKRQSGEMTANNIVTVYLINSPDWAEIRSKGKEWWDNNKEKYTKERYVSESII